MAYNVQGLRTGPDHFILNTLFLRSITSAHELTQVAAGWVGGRPQAAGAGGPCYAALACPVRLWLLLFFFNRGELTPPIEFHVMGQWTATAGWEDPARFSLHEIWAVADRV